MSYKWSLMRKLYYSQISMFDFTKYGLSNEESDELRGSIASSSEICITSSESDEESSTPLSGSKHKSDKNGESGAFENRWNQPNVEASHTRNVWFEKVMGKLKDETTRMLQETSQLLSEQRAIYGDLLNHPELLDQPAAAHNLPDPEVESQVESRFNQLCSSESKKRPCEENEVSIKKAKCEVELIWPNSKSGKPKAGTSGTQPVDKQPTINLLVQQAVNEKLQQFRKEAKVSCIITLLFDETVSYKHIRSTH
jgi:hypothetical protein